jgi:hypothetical protein
LHFPATAAKIGFFGYPSKKQAEVRAGRRVFPEGCNNLGDNSKIFCNAKPVASAIFFGEKSTGARKM